MKKAMSLVLVIAISLGLCACAATQSEGNIPASSSTVSGNNTQSQPSSKPDEQQDTQASESQPSTTQPSTTQPPATQSTTPPATTQAAQCNHSYTASVTREATCTAAGEKTYKCSACGDSYTESIPVTDHSYKDANCTEPKTCSACTYTEGSALGHDYQSGICTRCSTKDNSYCQLNDGNWYYISDPADSWADSVFTYLSFENGTWYGRYYITHEAYLALPDVPNWYELDYDLDEIRQGWDLVEVGGKTYGLLTFAMIGMGNFEISEDSATGKITVTFDESTSYDGAIWVMELKRISKNQLELTSRTGDVFERFLPVGTVFTCFP